MNMYPPTPGTRYSNAVHSRPLGPNPRPSLWHDRASFGWRAAYRCLLVNIHRLPAIHPARSWMIFDGL